MAVYPRWRGEHGLVGTSTTYADGLSPLARGTPFGLKAVALMPRFIPAGAGNTIPARLSSGRTAVYPRWCGEHGRLH